MISKKHKFQSRLDDSFFKNARRLYGEYLTLFYLKNPADKFKLMIIIPKKVAAKATLRNKYKRIIKELINSKFKNIGHYQIVLSLKKDLDFRENIEKDMEKLFGKIK